MSRLPYYLTRVDGGVGYKFARASSAMYAAEMWPTGVDEVQREDIEAPLMSVAGKTQHDQREHDRIAELV